MERLHMPVGVPTSIDIAHDPS
ncbi:uncharacterized protein G2W53_014126 [Senna tora]|uniref:Uncharacterized protein n=1 Tax=Senna tora TaxID=362788 RepID=A0A834WSW7_9FABA|nr:uncharacterized protein G2W53_014126 [Senna tora]